MNIEKFIQETFVNGGSTYNPRYENPTDGYMVSMPQYERIIRYDRRQLEAAIKELMAIAYDELARPGYYLGAWVDEADGALMIYVDISVNYQDKSTALLQAKRWDQLAIYDVYNDEVIMTF